MLQQVGTLRKHPELLRSSVERGRGWREGGGRLRGRGLVPVWEAGVSMPRGKESPSTPLLADKRAELIMCNVIAPPLPLLRGVPGVVGGGVRRGRVHLRRQRRVCRCCRLCRRHKRENMQTEHVVWPAANLVSFTDLPSSSQSC